MMNKKRITLLVLSFICTIAFMAIPNKTNASTPLTTPLYYGIQEYRSGTTPTNMGYAINNPDANGATTESIVGTKIWQIVKYNSNSDVNYVTGNYYCIRSGVGFSDTNKKAEYNISYDFKTEKAEIASSGNTVLYNIVSNGYYENILALTDLFYLKDVSTAEERASLLEKAGISTEDYTYILTDSDIEAVQQAALWYYSNHDDTLFSKLFDNLGENKTSWLFYRTLEMSQRNESYTSLSDYNISFNSFGKQNGEGLQRQEQAVLLYNYLINTANANAQAYKDGTADSKTKITLYANATEQNTQPIILIEKAPEVKEFDLALRKYITKIDGVELTTDNSRVPDIDKTTIETTQTATYKHRKDPVVVKNGTIVTYNLTIYNEGEKAGRATKIVDQLPIGLTSNLLTGEKVTSTKGNEYVVTFDSTTNRITFETTGTNNLVAYDGTNLDSDTIEIQCTVTAKPDSTSNKILTNVAWISEEFDAVANKTITTEVGKDRDSEPATTPSVNKDNMSDYKGTTNETDLSKKIYYPGQQDDDDFEKLELEKLNENSYNIVLIKEDADGEQLDSKATFNVNGVEKEVTGKLEIASDVKINSDNYTQDDVYTIKETKAPDKYCKFNGTITITVTKELDDNIFKVKEVKYTVKDDNGNDITNKTGDTIKVYLNENGNIYVEVKNYQFDLKLIKRIVSVNGENVPERILDVDITKLANKTATTADYNLDKTPVAVKKGDIVKYTFRVYNEGNIDGYASEITEDIPDGLEFIWSEKTENELEEDTTLSEQEKEAIKYNQGIWDIKTINTTTNKVEYITTDYLAKGKGAEISNEGANLIKAFDSTKAYTNKIDDKNPDYREVSVYLKVVAENKTRETIRNEAAITKDTDSEGNPVDDRDSDTDKWIKYEDDEDYDNIILQSFDLALRKFITGVNDKEVTSRIPEVKYDEENNKITYEHTKEPVEVSTGNIVTYTIRVYNEGDIDGFASKITDDIPDGLEYLPENELNTEYRWKMYDSEGKVTEDVSKAVKITTDYLSKEQGEARMKKDSQITENPALLTAFDKDAEISDTNPDYADVKVAFKVVEPSTSNKILVNSAQISDDTDKNGKPIDDDDSTPDKWIDGEDDQDKEYVKLTYFDLALRKWVTHAIIVEDGKENVIQTGHKAEDDPEQVVKVELNRKKLSSLTVKFKYSIRVTNEGDIAGYAKEITDYIPEGLKFVAEDNPDWKDEGNNVISTRKLENKLLQPGESAEVTVILTWINGKDNLGLKVNTAEISEDYNDRDVPDRDSTPDNQIPGEDDIDDAPVLISITTGQEKMYLTLGLTILITIAGGIILIKKFVL